MKRIFLVFGAGLGLAAPSALLAQHGTWRATSPAPAQRAVERRPQPAVVVVPPANYQPVYYPGAYPQGYPGVVYPVAYTTIPAVLMSDGTIWANFGAGYEPVSQACGMNGYGQIVMPNGMVITNPASLPYTPPVPAQTTASYNALPSVQAAAQRSAAAQSACFARYANGQYVVIR